GKERHRSSEFPRGAISPAARPFMSSHGKTPRSIPSGLSGASSSPDYNPEGDHCDREESAEDDQVPCILRRRGWDRDGKGTFAGREVAGRVARPHGEGVRPRIGKGPVQVEGGRGEARHREVLVERRADDVSGNVR